MSNFAQDERILNEKRRYGDRPFDLYPISRTDLSDLNLALFSYDYLPKAFSEEVLEANDRSLEEQLAATKMITAVDDTTATVLGILTIGKIHKTFCRGLRIEVLSPGGVFGTITAENFGEPGYVDYRNPNLADAMCTFGFVQRFSMGIPIARRLLAASRHPEPKFEIDSTFARAIIQARSSIV